MSSLNPNNQFSSQEEADLNNMNVPSLSSSPEIDSFVIIKSCADLNFDDESEFSDNDLLLHDTSLGPEQKQTLTEELEKLDINNELMNKRTENVSSIIIIKGNTPEDIIQSVASLQSSVRSTTDDDQFSEEIHTKLAQLMKENATLKETVLQNNENLRMHYERVATWQKEVETIEQRNKDALLQEKRVIAQLKEEISALKCKNAMIMMENKPEIPVCVLKSSDEHFSQEIHTQQLADLKKENATLKETALQNNENKSEDTIPVSVESTFQRSTGYHFSQEIYIAQLMEENATLLKEKELQNNIVEIMEQRNNDALLEENRLISQLKHENKALKCEKTKLTEKLSQQCSELENLTKTCVTLETTLNEERNSYRNDYLKYCKENLKALFEKQDEINRLKVETNCGKLTVKLEEKKRVIAQLKHENQALKCENAELTEKLPQQWSELEYFTKSCKMCETTQNEEINSKENEQWKSCTENLEALFEQEKKMNSLKENLSKAETECAKLTEELAEEKRVISRLHVEYATLKCENAEIVKKSSQQCSELENLSKTCATLEIALNEERNLYRNEFLVVKKNLLKTQTENAKLVQELAQKEHVISQLNEENVTLTCENAEITEKSNQLQSDLDNLSKTLETAISREKKLYQDDFFIFKEKLMKSEAEREKLTEELIDARCAISQINFFDRERRYFEKEFETESNRESEMERKKLAEELAQEKRVISQLKEENAKFAEKSSQQLNELENLTETCATLKTALNEAKKLHQEDLIIFTEKAMKSETKCAKLTQELADLKVNHQEMLKAQQQQMPNHQQQIMMYQQSIERMREDHFKLREQLEQSQKSLTVCEQKRAVISAQFTVLQQTNRQLETQRVTASQLESDQFVALKAQLDTYKSDFEAELEIKENLRREFNKMADDFQHLHQRNQQLQDEVALLRNRQNGGGAGGGRNSSESTSTSSSSARSNSPIPTTFACPICSQKFRSYKMIQEHLDTCVGINPDQ